MALRCLSRAANYNGLHRHFCGSSPVFTAPNTSRRLIPVSSFHTTTRRCIEKSSGRSQQQSAAASTAAAAASTTTTTPEEPTGAQDKFLDEVHFLGDAAGQIVIRSPPTFATADAARQYHKQHLAAAFRVFARQGFDEGVAGHISLRDPAHPHHFWINPLSKHFSQIRVSDLVLVDERGHVLPGGAQLPINGPAFAIHSEIHKARPDVHAACHAHSVYGKAFSTFARPIEPLYQDAIRFYNDLSGTFIPHPPSDSDTEWEFIST